jgi:hypothetical protein
MHMLWLPRNVHVYPEQKPHPPGNTNSVPITTEPLRRIEQLMLLLSEELLI